MNEIILNYIVQSILGGASGYITNDYAINMLFKEYTPLKIGGVIKKTRHEFIENLSNLVENDIINKEKLQSILSDEGLKKEFDDLTADFYENCLYEAFGNNTFANIDDFYLTIKSTDLFAAKIISEHMNDIYEIFLDNLDLGSFLTQNQLNTITNTLYTSLANIINNTDVVKHMILSLYKANKNLSFNDVIDKNIYKTVIENSTNILLNDPEKHKDKIEDIFNSLDLSKVLNSSKEIFYSKKVKDIIRLDENAINIFNESLLTYLNSDKGTLLIQNLFNSIFSYGRESNKSISEFLNSSFEENLNIYLIDNIPSLTANIVDWLRENSYSIDMLIKDSIDEVIKESDGLKAKLLSSIKNSYFNNLSKKYSIVDKIISYVQKIADPDKLSISISDKIIEMLNNLTIGEIILEAEKNNITPDSATKLILNYINKNSKTLISKTAEYISNLEVKKAIPKELVNEETKKYIIKKLYQFSRSNNAKEYINKALINNIDNIFSKELNSLLSEKQAETISLKVKEYINKKSVANENQIKKWIKQEIENRAYNLSFTELDTKKVNILNDEVFNYYKKATENLKDIPIKAALNKLNSIDNISKNSSESLRSYAVENTDVILSGSIKAIVTDNLNKLNDDQLVDLANDFIGRELKPIMYFGGILGVAAGLILAAFQSSPLDPAEIKITNMLVYSFVGYLTNVIAINMIFKPYEENKFLSKVPFLRNFSLGYIIKNQKTFAKNTAHFIDNSLLSKESISLLFDKYKDKIKSSFTESIANNEYKTFMNILANNKNNIIKGIFSIFKNKANYSKFSSFIYKKFCNIKLISFINEKTTSKTASFLNKKLHEPTINNKIYTLISSENSLESKISKDKLKEVISDVEKNCYDKISRVVSNEDELNSIISQYDKRYENYINNQINEIINNDELENLANITKDKLSNLVLDKNSREQITNKIIKLINKSMDKNKTFEELFDGKFKDYINSKTPIILEQMSTAITANIKSNKTKITILVQSEIKSHLGFIEKGMYSLMGGDEIIDELLTKIIVHKIPKFMEEKKSELKNIADTLLEDRFFKTKVDVLYTGLNKLQLNEFVNSYLNENNSYEIKNKINVITNDLFLKAGHIKLNKILYVFNADTLESILNNYDNEINAFTNELSLNLNTNKEVVIEKVLNLTDSLIDDFMNVNFKEAFRGVSIEDVNHVKDKILEELNKNNLDKIINESLNEAKSNLDITVGKLIDKNEFDNSMEKYFITVFESPEFEKTIKNSLEAVIDDSLEVNFNFINDNTKGYILNVFTDSCILSLKRNMDKILKSIEFDKIAREEIEKMEPEKIHEMFNSFGGKYFNRLMLYGFGGFVFGINMYIGFSLTILKIISELFKKKD